MATIGEAWLQAVSSWIRRVIERAEAIRRLSPPALLAHHRQSGFELG
jgi:hypothetical protein